MSGSGIRSRTTSWRRLELAVEHRSAAAPEPIGLELFDEVATGPYLRMREGDLGASDPPELGERVLEFLGKQQEAVKLDVIRRALRVRMQSVVDVLRDLEAGGRVLRDACGWRAGPPADTG